MSLQNQDIPTDWETVEIGQINEYQSSNINPSSYSEEIFELYSVPTFRTGFPEFLKGKDIGSTKQCVEPDDILLCKINPRINRVWRVNDKKKLKQIASSEWIIVRQKGLNSDFLKFYFRELNFRNKLCLDVSGVGGSLTRAQPKRVSKYHIPIPPLPEQKQIAARLDALLAQVDTLKTRLDAISTILKRFRQSVLAAAVSGKLTAEWRKTFNKKLDIISIENIKKRIGSSKVTPELFEIASMTLPILPDSWQVVASGDLFVYVTSGSRGWAKYYSDKGDIFIRVTNLDHTTIYLDLSDIQRVSLPEKAEGKRSLVKIDDLLISITADVGMIACVDRDLGEAYINQHVALARPNIPEYSKYIATVIASLNIGQKQIDAFKRGATKVGLGLDDIRSMAIPLPPIEEASEIVRQVDQFFAFADQIEQRVTEARKRVDHLTQSILAKAFRGDLTADWRAQNPDLISGKNSAQALLEQIKRERDRLTKVGKTKSKNATRKKGNTMMPKQIIPIIEALTAAEKPLKAQELLSQAGYPNDAGTDQLEAFFLDIREKLKLGTISRVRQGEDDIFELVK